MSRKKCKVCAKSFKEKAAVRKHLVIHSGERLFTCGVCDKSFSRKTVLKTHLATHSRIFKCDVCDTSFAQNVYLTNPLRRVHSGERSLKYNV